jgi:hypothetical protein
VNPLSRAAVDAPEESCGRDERQFFKYEIMEKQVIVLEFTPNQLKHLARLSEALRANSNQSIKSFQFPREFREKFDKVFFEEIEESQPLLESAGFRRSGRIKPTNLMLALHRFHHFKKV